MFKINDIVTYKETINNVDYTYGGRIFRIHKEGKTNCYLISEIGSDRVLLKKEKELTGLE